MQVVPGNAASLSFANHVRCFDPLNHRPGGGCRSWSLHSAQSPLYVTVIGFDSVIAIASRALAAVPRDLSFAYGENTCRTTPSEQ